MQDAAQAFFCLAASMAVISSRWWIGQKDSRWSGTGDLKPAGRGRILFRLAALSVVVIYLQLIVGAMMRHYNAGLAIPDPPLAYGHWPPPMSSGLLR